MEHIYESIDGNSVDIPPFYRLMVAGARQGARFIELGAYKGRSTAYMAVEIANMGAVIHFDVYDLWEDAAQITRNASHPYEPATMEECARNLAPLVTNGWEVFGDAEARLGYVGPGCVMTLRKRDTANAAIGYLDKTIDFVFVDGDHSYDGCLRDIRAWLPKVRQGGVIAGHDHHFEYPGVMRAVREVFGTNYKTRGIVWAHMVET